MLSDELEDGETGDDRREESGRIFEVEAGW
jgi:hypothetical protein